MTKPIELRQALDEFTQSVDQIVLLHQPNQQVRWQSGEPIPELVEPDDSMPDSAAEQVTEGSLRMVAVARLQEAHLAFIGGQVLRTADTAYERHKFGRGYDQLSLEVTSLQSNQGDRLGRVIHVMHVDDTLKKVLSVKESIAFRTAEEDISPLRDPQIQSAYDFFNMLDCGWSGMLRLFKQLRQEELDNDQTLAALFPEAAAAERIDELQSIIAAFKRRIHDGRLANPVTRHLRVAGTDVQDYTAKLWRFQRDS